MGLSLSRDGRTLVYKQGEAVVAKLLPSGVEKTLPVPGLTGVSLVSGDGTRALVTTKTGRLALDLQTGLAAPLPDGLEPVSAGAVDVFRTRLGPLQIGDKLLPPGFHEAAADPRQKLVLLAGDKELAVYDAKKAKIVARRPAQSPRLLGPGLVAVPGAIEEVALPGLRGKVLWRGRENPLSAALTKDALYIVTGPPPALHKVYRDTGVEVWKMPWTARPTALLGESGGLLYVSDGVEFQALTPEPARLALYKEQQDAPPPAPSPAWLIPAALIAGLLIVLRLARELRGPSYRRRR